MSGRRSEKQKTSPAYCPEAPRTGQEEQLPLEGSAGEGASSQGSMFSLRREVKRRP